MSACGDEFVSLVEEAASRLANDDVFLADTKVATFGDKRNELVSACRHRHKLIIIIINLF